MQTQLQLGRYIHVCLNETHCLANLQDLILLWLDCAAYNYTCQSWDYAKEYVSFKHTWMYLPNWNCVYMIG